MKMLALPRNANPYQEQLYAEVRRLGAPVRYLGDLTPSRTLNLLLLPFETLVRAAAGWRTVHVHWLFDFALPGGHRFPLLRRISQAWFHVWIAAARLAHVRVIWTAHNALPHGRLFHDDLAARRALVRASRLVIAHNEETLRTLDAMGLTPRESAVVPHGPMAIGAADGGRVPGSSPGPRRFLFFGQVQEYKGVEDLLAAAALVPADVRFTLVVAGRCPDAGLRERVERAAATAGDRVSLRLRHVPDAEAVRLLDEADVVVLPFRRITTSGSLYLALTHGRPVIVPALAALDDLPSDAAERYDGTIPGLAGAMADACLATPARLERMSRAARAHVSTGWDVIAERTLTAISVAGRTA